MKIAVNIIDVEEQNVEFVLEKSCKGDEIIWSKTEDEYAGPDFALEFILNSSDTKPKAVKKGNNIADDVEELKYRFSELLFEENMVNILREEDGFETVDESEPEGQEKLKPYNPKLIRVDTKPFPIYQINQMILEGDIDLSPDFQRGFVWNDITSKSRLIESLLLRIPLPVFYFAQDDEGLFQVVDGVQRLTVIKSFLNNEFKLKNLEYLHDCEGKWFKNPLFPKELSLSGMYARRIEQTQLFVNVIDPQTPYKVKYDIFKRINTGGKALNSQEIRNCLANARTREFLHTLARSEEFLTATRGSISPTRMADEELILRFIAFYLIDNGLSTVEEYRGGMDELLNETIHILNKSDMDIFKPIRLGFLNAMDNAWYIFGDQAFRKARFINKSLFLGLTRILRKYKVEEVKKMDTEKIREDLEEAIKSNILFTNALSMATNDARNVKLVYEMISKIIGENLDEQEN